MFEWSHYQKLIFENVQNGVGHSLIIARAGSSKTTTAIESLKYLPKNLNTLMVAFNKSIAEELRDRVSSYVDALTLHSLGYRAVRNRFGSDIVLDPQKIQKLAFKLLEDGYGEKPKYDLLFSFERTIWLCKASLIDTPSKIDELIDKYGVDVCNYEREEFIKIIIQLLRLSKEQTKVVDYNDMIWFPVVYNLDVGKYDIVYIDELQDLTKTQITLALSAVKKDGRVIACGDPMQCLYSWVGVDPQSIYKLQKQLDAKIFLLPITYRCPKKITKLAQEIVPDIQAAPNAKEGAVFHIKEDKLLKVIKPGDFVLSRTNAPLIKYCLGAIKLGIPANIWGRDVAAGLIYLLRSSKKEKISSFLKWLKDWEVKEIVRLKEKNRNANILQDKVECLEILCDGIERVEDVILKINEMFRMGNRGDIVNFLTSHKSKGSEADRIFMLESTYKYSGEEEDRVWYVSITRAKKELYFVNK